MRIDSIITILDHFNLFPSVWLKCKIWNSVYCNGCYFFLHKRNFPVRITNWLICYGLDGEGEDDCLLNECRMDCMQTLRAWHAWIIRVYSVLIIYREYLLTLLWGRYLTSSTQWTSSWRSRCLVYEERNLALFEAKVHEAVTLMHWIATEGLPEEDMPVWLPFLIHVLLDNFSNLNKI